MPRCLPVRSAGPGDVEHVVEELEGEADAAAEGAERGRRRPPASSAPSRHAASNSRAVFSSQRAQVALDRHVGVPGVGALEQLARGERASSRRTATRTSSARPFAASSANARANSRSPVAVAASRPAAGDDRRRARGAAAAASSTSSWTSVAQWTSSTAAAARTSALAVAALAGREEHEQRPQALAARGDRRARVLGERRAVRRPRARRGAPRRARAAPGTWSPAARG